MEVWTQVGFWVLFLCGVATSFVLFVVMDFTWIVDKTVWAWRRSLTEVQLTARNDDGT